MANHMYVSGSYYHVRKSCYWTICSDRKAPSLCPECRTSVVTCRHWSVCFLVIYKNKSCRCQVFASRVSWIHDCQLHSQYVNLLRSRTVSRKTDTDVYEPPQSLFDFQCLSLGLWPLDDPSATERAEDRTNALFQTFG